MISQFADIFVQMVVLFAVGATGYAAKRLNLMDEDFDKKFSKLILNTALPALILASVLTAETLDAAALTRAVATVARRAACFFMSHDSLLNAESSKRLADPLRLRPATRRIASGNQPKNGRPASKDQPSC